MYCTKGLSDFVTINNEKIQHPNSSAFNILVSVLLLYVISIVIVKFPGHFYPFLMNFRFLLPQVTSTLQVFSNVELPSIIVSIMEDDEAFIVFVPPEDLDSSVTRQTVFIRNEVYFFTREDANLTGQESN